MADLRGLSVPRRRRCATAGNCVAYRSDSTITDQPRLSASLPSSPVAHKPWYPVLYVQVLIAVVIGIAIGAFFPGLGTSLKPLGDGFIKLIKMMIAPIIFCTVVHGVASMSDMRKLGRVGVKTLIYFEVVSTLALVIGLIVVNVFKPGAGFDRDPKTFDPQLGQTYSHKARSMDPVSFFLNIIPNTLSAPCAS